MSVQILRPDGSWADLPSDLVNELVLDVLAEKDPITHSLEGLDDACWWCEADGWTTINHFTDCLWARAWTQAGQELPDGHTWGATPPVWRSGAPT